MANSIDRVLASAVEGQAQSPRFVQSQLSSLHAALKKEGPAIRATIESESRHTTAEIQIQYALALEAVAALFAESNLEKALEVEYWLARRESSLSHSVAYPLAYILPSSYNFFNACVTAVAAAIAAGSCVILEVPKMLSKTSELTQTTLIAALDPDVFIVVDKRIDVASLPQHSVRLFGSAEPNVVYSRTDLVPPSTRTVAIVDRAADMQKAAKAISRARFSFAGQSPRAPDLVLVDEFRIKEFCAQIAKLTSQYFATQLEVNGPSPKGTVKARIPKISAQSSNKRVQRSLFLDPEEPLPVSPVGFGTSLRGFYTREMFKLPKPEFISYSDRSRHLARLIDGNEVSEAMKLRRAAESLETKMNQPAGRAIGFFEQGILVGI